VFSGAHLLLSGVQDPGTVRTWRRRVSMGGVGVPAADSVDPQFPDHKTRPAIRIAPVSVGQTGDMSVKAMGAVTLNAVVPPVSFDIMARASPSGRH